MKSKTIITLFPLLCMVLCVACNHEQKKFRIGVSQCSQDDWRRKMNDEIMREMMLHEDAVVEIRSADDSNEKQIEDIRYFKENGFDILIVSPNEAEPLTPVVREVYNSGMPVIIFDRNINDTTYTARIGADDKGLGRAAARYSRTLTDQHPTAIEIYGLPGSTPAEDRSEGFTREFTENGGVIVASAPANWNKEDAERVTDSLLNIYTDIDLIFAHNDRMAIGASETAVRKGRGHIPSIGIDAAPNIGVKAVSEGTIDATFLYPTGGKRLISTALDILKGKDFKKETVLPALSAIDASNADIILEQNDALTAETQKLNVLKGRLDKYLTQHATQTSLFYSAIIILILILCIAFILLRVFWVKRKHQEELMERNRMLEEERDKQKLLNEKLEQATQSKLVFFTNVSHDLRTPLTLIAEPVAQLANAPNLTDGQKRLMHIADKNVRILQRLINQILDFRKYENGKLDLKLRETDLDADIREWSDSFRALAVKRRIKLYFVSSSNKDYHCAVDVEKIERVVFNLISNAFKYTPDNGTVSISLDNSDGRITIRVTDTGEGISERDMGNIFDRFFQVDRVHPNGSGIGLSLAKAFIELHGGSIAVQSTLDKGSVFTVTIPIRHVETEAGSEEGKTISEETVSAEMNPLETVAEFSDEKPVLLVIDDNKDIQKLIGELLGSEYNVINASNGKDGLKMASKYVPDIIICDVMMPGIDGLETCKAIKNEVSTSHIPVLMLTACSLDEQRVQGYESGADGYMSKPFNYDVLRSRAKSLIDNRRRIKELWGGMDRTKIDRDRKESSKKLPVSEIDSDFYRKFLEIFNAEMGNSEVSVDELASRMGLGRSQFYRKIKALTNYSPVELIRKLRLEKARTLLLSTDKSISEIGYETGFSTPAYFTKCYREAYGQTPSESRS